MENDKIRVILDRNKVKYKETKRSFIIPKEVVIVTKNIWTKEQSQDLDRRFKESETRIFAYVDKKVKEVNTRIDLLENRMDAIEQRMDTIEKRMDAIENRMDAIEQRMDAIEKRMDAIEQRMDRIEEKLEVLINVLTKDKK